ncbi:MAG TPA: methyltransferase domain-containing protein [Pseudonocardiaceae bacterium]|nr:methyltransferase domain-containing protein [Pseudonocardiaceae bacterium]
MADEVRSKPADLARVRAYYDQTWFDYRLFWFSSVNLAIHFGYWDATTRNHGEALFAINRVLADTAGVRAGDRVLDAGCGVGGSAIWLAAHCGAEVVGITPVASQVARARAYARRRGIDGLVTFEQQDYLDTSYADASFDVVWAQESATHTERKDAFLAEAFRLLRPGGRLVIVDFFRWRRPYAEPDERQLLGALADWASPDLSTVGEFDAWARQAGFVDITWRDITDNVRPSLQRLYLLAMAMYPAGVVMRTMRLRNAVQHGNMRGAVNGWRTLRRGLWHESIMVARKPRQVSAVFRPTPEVSPEV